MLERMVCIFRNDDQIIYSALPKGMSPKTSKLELINVVEKHGQKFQRLIKKQTKLFF